MIELLELGADHGWDRLRIAVEQSLSMGCHDGAAIRHLLTAEQFNRPVIAAIEIGDLARYERSLPVMTSYSPTPWRCTYEALHRQPGTSRRGSTVPRLASARRGRSVRVTGRNPAVELGAVMVGGTVNRVVRSRNPRFREGELVLGSAGWQEYSISGGKELVSLGEPADPSHFLGILGMPGFTAYTGLLKIGQPKPGDTVVVAAASGAVGSVVGQIAKLKGAHVIGIAGGAKKCDFVATTLGFDACIDHRSKDFTAKLAAACPKGIDVYFENVGGTVFDAVFPLLNTGARIPVCGLIAHYNDHSLPSEPDRLPSFLMSVLARRLKFQGFIISDFYESGFDEFRHDMTQWVAHGAIKAHKDVVVGLEKAPEAFIGMLRGQNFGKLVVKVDN